MLPGSDLFRPDLSHKIKSCILSASFNSFKWTMSWTTKSDPDLIAAEKKQFIDDQRKRNAVEGKIGECKRRYGLGLICEELIAT